MPDDNSKHNYSGEDNEIEIVDLPSSETDATMRPFNSRRISLRPRYSLKQRRRQALISGGIALVLLLILIGAWPAHDSITALLSLASTNAVKETGQSNFFYFQTVPNWGRWYLDGKPLTRAPVFSDEQPLRISAGKHTITWRAEPFQDATCILLVPPDLTQQTCRTRRLGENEFASSSNVIGLPLAPSITQLPNAQREALLQAVHHYLDALQSSTTVQTGEPYRYNATGMLHIAAQTLQARLRIHLDTDTSAPAMCTGPQLGSACTNAANGSDCRIFCTLAWSDHNTPDRPFSWDVAVVTRPEWEYIPPGQQSDVNAAHKENQGDQQYTTLHITWIEHTWHVSAHPQGDSPFDDPNCIAVVAKIPNMLPFGPRGGGNGVGGNGGSQVIRNFVSGTNRAMGCVAIAQIDKTSSEPSLQTTTTSHAYFLWRFNVLLAANEQAHLLWKDLPTSGEGGKRLVQEITEHPAFES